MLIACLVADSERQVWSMAREKLRDSLVRVSNRDWSVNLAFVDSPAALVAEKADVAVISLLRALDEATTLEDLALQLERDASALVTSGGAVFLCSIFRACADREKLERIRRLNLLAVEISRQTGAAIIDLDRFFANFGARPLETDCRLGGAKAADFAARIMTDALLAVGFDDDVPADVLSAAQRHNRGASQL